MSFCPNPNSKAYKELSEFLNDDQINELYGKFVSDDFIKFYFSINDISSDFLKRYKIERLIYLSRRPCAH